MTVTNHLSSIENKELQDFLWKNHKNLIDSYNLLELTQLLKEHEFVTDEIKIIKNYIKEHLLIERNQCPVIFTSLMKNDLSTAEKIFKKLSLRTQLDFLKDLLIYEDIGEDNLKNDYKPYFLNIYIENLKNNYGQHIPEQLLIGNNLLIDYQDNVEIFKKIEFEIQNGLPYEMLYVSILHAALISHMSKNNYKSTDEYINSQFLEHTYNLFNTLPVHLFNTKPVKNFLLIFLHYLLHTNSIDNNIIKIFKRIPNNTILSKFINEEVQELSPESYEEVDNLHKIQNSLMYFVKKFSKLELYPFIALKLQLLESNEDILSICNLALNNENEISIPNKKIFHLMNNTTFDYNWTHPNNYILLSTFGNSLTEEQCEKISHNLIDKNQSLLYQLLTPNYQEIISLSEEDLGFILAMIKQPQILLNNIKDYKNSNIENIPCTFLQKTIDVLLLNQDNKEILKFIEEEPLIYIYGLIYTFNKQKIDIETLIDMLVICPDNITINNDVFSKNFFDLLVKMKSFQHLIINKIKINTENLQNETFLNCLIDNYSHIYDHVKYDVYTNIEKIITNNNGSIILQNFYNEIRI